MQDTIEREDEDVEGGQLVVRKTIYDVLDIRRQILEQYERMCASDKAIQKLFDGINAYDFYDFRLKNYCDKTPAQLTDRECWEYFVKIYQLEKYMLCTEYQKLSKQIESFDFPEFTKENAETWLLSLKGMVYESIQKLMEDVFNRITQGTYRTGASYNSSVKKKRNNNGIDKWFILSTNDQYSMNYWSGNPTITDDLEKACYIIDGKLLPEMTIKEAMRRGKIWESENQYFKIRVCKNGNTQYRLNEDIRSKLNFYGSKRGIIGENVKIKIFEKEKW